jgi:ABC-type multidrug transport system fused ATPase/permease subunit
LKNVTFEVKKGEILGIFGKIGSGKSTIIKLLLGLYDDYTGKIMVNNSSFSNMAAIRERVGVIPQDSYLFNESIVENVKIANTKCEPADIDNIIKRLELDQLIERKGANHKISPDGSDLSGGERQKIAAARLIFKNPDVVIIDEGTSNLDAHSEYVIKEEIFEYFKERIIIIISHRFNNIILCDRIIYLKEGKIVDIDSHMNLFEKYADYKELYLKQEKRGQKKKKVTMP